MKLVTCKKCKRWKFFDTKENKDIWEKPDAFDEVAIEIIKTSFKLLILVEGFEQYSEVCNECLTAKQN